METKPKTVTVTIRLQPDLVAAIVEMATNDDRSFTYVVAKLLRESLALKALDAPKD